MSKALLIVRYSGIYLEKFPLLLLVSGFVKMAGVEGFEVSENQRVTGGGEISGRKGLATVVPAFLRRCQNWNPPLSSGKTIVLYI